MGSGCGSISLIVAYRNPESEVIGFEKNKIHHQVAILNHKENNFDNLKFKIQDNCIFDPYYENYFDLILSNPPFYFANKVIQSRDPSINTSKYISESDLEKWLNNIILYLKTDGTAFIINAVPSVLKYKIKLFNHVSKSDSDMYFDVFIEGSRD